MYHSASLLPNIRVFQVCLQSNTVIVGRELLTSGFDWQPACFSTRVGLRVALCGQDCLRSGEGGAGGGEQSRPVETADRGVGKVSVVLQDILP